MPVDERKIHLREALAQKSTEELDDLLAISFSEQADTDAEYIEMILEEIKRREDKDNNNEEALKRAWADFKEFAAEREACDSEFEDLKDFSDKTGGEGEPSPEHIRKTGQKTRKMSRIVRNVLVAAVLAALLIGTACGLDLFKSIAKWGSETFGFRTGLEDDGKNERDVFYSLRLAARDLTSIPTVPQNAPEGTEAVGTMIKTVRNDRSSFSLKYTVEERVFTVLITVYDTLPEKRPGTYQKDAEIEKTYTVNGIDHCIMGNNSNLSAAWVNGCVEGHIQGELTLEEMEDMLRSIYEE